MGISCRSGPSGALKSWTAISVGFDLETICALVTSLSTIWRQWRSGTMDKLSSLRAFVKVVESGSFAEAGRQLRLSRSAISKYIGELEASLGVQLIVRTTRHASPTERSEEHTSELQSP